MLQCWFGKVGNRRLGWEDISRGFLSHTWGHFGSLMLDFFWLAWDSGMARRIQPILLKGKEIFV